MNDISLSVCLLRKPTHIPLVYTLHSHRVYEWLRISHARTACSDHATVRSVDEDLCNGEPIQLSCSFSAPSRCGQYL